MYDFAYHRPATLEQAADLLRSLDDPVLMAGGQTMIPTLKQRLASPSDVIDLAGVPGLAKITANKAMVVVGAMARHAEVAAAPEVRITIPALAMLAGAIADLHVRTLGTLGGSIANNDPAADYPAALLALGATVVTTTRDIAADDFFTGMFETALDDDEILTSVRFPVPETAAYEKFEHPASRYALVGVFVAKTEAGVRVAVTGAGSCVYRETEIEAALSANFSPDALDGITIPAEGLNTDLHAAADYRAHLIKVMAARAVMAAIDAVAPDDGETDEGEQSPDPRG